MAWVPYAEAMKVTRKSIAHCIETILEDPSVRMATVYFSESLVVRGTARFRPDRRTTRTEILLTIGRPNFVERRFIRMCKRAGEPLPVKKVQVKWWKKLS